MMKLHWVALLTSLGLYLLSLKPGLKIDGVLDGSLDLEGQWTVEVDQVLVF